MTFLGAAPFWAAPPWPVGLVATVLAGVLLWTVSGRLRLRPETRAASTALFACGALLSEATTDGVDGRATLLLTAGAVCASAGRRRSALAALAGAGAIAVAPVVGVAVLVLFGAMALTRDLAARLPVVRRHLLGWSGVGAGAGLAVWLGYRGAQSPDALTVAPAVAAALVAAAVLVGGVLWTRLSWVRAPIAAVAALAACVCLPGAGPDAVLPATAGVAVLGAVLVEEYRGLFGRPVLVGATVAGVAATAGLLLPALPGPAPTPVPQARVVPVEDEVAVVRPVSIDIPALGVAGPLDELTTGEDGELLAPEDPGRAGWYAGGVVPGAVGPAVIGGHVDSRRGPGVFVALKSLRPGDAVAVALSDGRTVRFTVTGVHEVPKAQFPTAAVYAPTPRAELRLITCGGRFDRAVRSYEDNVVVDAVMDAAVDDDATERDEKSPVRLSR